MKTKCTKEEILSFNPNDWKYEISSGSLGYRNINEQSKYFGIWVSHNKYYELERIQKEYNNEFIYLKEFMCYINKYISDSHIYDFLDSKYFKN